jgi:hypothetical protein
MDDGKDHQRGIQSDDNPKDVDKWTFSGRLSIEAEYPIKPEKYRHQSPDIFSNHFKFLIPPVIVPNPEVVKSPEG